MVRIGIAVSVEMVLAQIAVALSNPISPTYTRQTFVIAENIDIANVCRIIKGADGIKKNTDEEKMLAIIKRNTSSFAAKS